MGTTYYTKTIRGRLYPVRARLENVAYAHESFIDLTTGRRRKRYLGVKKKPVCERRVEKGRNDNAPLYFDPLMHSFRQAYICLQCGKVIPPRYTEQHRKEDCKIIIRG